ncbi:MAG: hypothetical protein ACYC0F_04620 [Rhodanobacter sp.]
MPPQEPDTLDEKLPGEAELAALYRQLPQSEPGPALDAAVLHAAAQAWAADENPLAVERRRSPRERGDWVRPKDLPLRDLDSIGVDPRPHRRPLPPWLLTLGSAASLVLVAGLAWHMREWPPATSTPAAVDRAAPAQATAAGAPAAAMPPPPPEPPKQPPPKMIATSLPAPAPHALRKAAADQGEERVSGKVRATGGLDTHAALPAAAPPAPSAILQETSGSPVEAAPDIPVTAAAPAVAPPAETTAPNTGDTPARELDKIRRLFAQGHDDEARQRLSAFRHAHPQWELPPELRAKLRKP